jgi:UDP-glucuronate decarboxylase
MIRMMNTPDDITGPVNLGNPSEFTILQIAKMIIELTGSKSEIVFSTLPQDDPCKRKPDITLAKKLLNDWEPELSLKEGLIKTIDYFKNTIK